MSIFNEISKRLSGNGQSVSLTISQVAAGSTRVIVAPIVGELPSNATEQHSALFEALSVPLCITGTPETIEAELTERLNSYTAKRDQLAPELKAIEEALSKSGKSSAKTTNPAKAEAPIKEEPLTADSLFDGSGGDDI